MIRLYHSPLPGGKPENQRIATRSAWIAWIKPSAGKIMQLIL